MSSKPRVLSLIQPTAESFHIGNLLGAVQYWPGLMEANDCFYGVADLHAFTVQTDPEVLRQRTLLSIAQLVAAGCDPDRGAVFVLTLPLGSSTASATALPADCRWNPASPPPQQCR